MTIAAVLPVVEIVARLIDKAIPDRQAAAQAQLNLLTLAQQGELAKLNSELQLALGQQATNTAEAQSASVFVSGWRPAVGWTCAGGLMYQLILRPLLEWIGGIYGWPIPPSLEMETLMILLFGLLGLGGYRTYEKVKGVAAK